MCNVHSAQYDILHIRTKYIYLRFFNHVFVYIFEIFFHISDFFFKYDILHIRTKYMYLSFFCLCVLMRMWCVSGYALIVSLNVMYLHVYICICMYIHIHIYVDTCTYIFTCYHVIITCENLRIQTQAQSQHTNKKRQRSPNTIVSMYIYKNTCIHTYIHIICIYIYI